MKKTIYFLLRMWVFLLFSLPLAVNAERLAPPGSETPIAEAPMPAAGFTFITNGSCAPVVVQFFSQLAGPSYNWTFGDGGTSTDCNPVHTYTTPGVYTVTLVATGGTYTTTITVGATPVVSLLTNDFACQNELTTYNISTTIPPASYSWSAQGGTTSNPNPTSVDVTWTNYGVNYLNYTITTADGCTKTFTFKIKVIPPPSINLPCCKKRENGTTKPTQGHEGVPGGDEPCGVCAGSYDCYQGFIDPQFGVAGDYTWNWTVTNGTIVSISPDSTKVCVVWGTSGIGTITIEITHKIYGCKNIQECELTINPGTTPAFTIDGNCISSPVNFNASATTPLSSVESYYWEFGDGYTETTSVPTASHQYAFTGTYTATLTITTHEGCEYKVSQTFTMVSGTKPEIECPGTICEGSRQCYSTASIGGATYVWNIAGDDPSLRVITGNKACVTWGSGPVGTISVTVLGGGYTCTNTATEVVPIISTNIPITGSDVVCPGAGFMEYSTVNYAGACYSWLVNGVPQTSTSNQLWVNTSAYTGTIKVEVFVKHELTCCEGKGLKETKILPQYTMAPYNGTECIGNSVTYFLIFPAGAPSTDVSWSADGGTITAFGPNWVTITWDEVGSGSITAGNNTPNQYCNDGSNSTWYVNVVAKATGDDISGPALVCGGATETYFHAYQSPTGSASVSVSPAGPVVSAGTYSSSITFPAVGSPTTYTVSVTYNHNSLSNCGTTKTYDVTVIPNTVPTFTIPPGNVCEGDIVTYTASMADPSYYEWEVIGGSIISESFASGVLTLQIQWNSTVNSSITVRNIACDTENTQVIPVNGKPVVIITPGPISCSSTGITLNVAPIWTSYTWTPALPSTPTVTVTSPGMYSVEVSNGVCKNTGSINVPFITPTPPVINSFTTTLQNDFCPKYYTVCPNITTGSGAIASYSWTFTGTNITTSSAPCPTFQVPASFTPVTVNWSLTVTDIYGCTHSRSGSLRDSCLRDTGCTNYVATFSATYNPCTEQFTTVGTNILSIFWDFGDGSTGNGINPANSYGSPCSKNVIAYVKDINGCMKPFPFSINIPYVINNPTISVNNTPCSGTTSITASGISVCTGSGLTPTYTWTITPAGSGTPVISGLVTSATLNVTTLGLANGNYNAQVVMVVAGCTATANNNFNIGGLVANFVSCGGCAGSPITFGDQSLQYQAPIIQWQWSVVGPPNYNSFLQNPTIDFTTPGTYTVTLTVTDNALCTDNHTVTINVLAPFNPGDIKVNGTLTPSGTEFEVCPEDLYTLDAPFDLTYTYQWSTGATTPSINVTEQGEYFVTVFNSSGCATKVGPIIFKYKPAAEAIILATVDECANRLLRAFTGVGYTYNWTYPPSGTSTQSFINLTTSGTVTLTVSNLYGCSSTISQFMNVDPKPFVSISAAPALFCPGTTVTLTASVTGGTSPFISTLWSNGATTSSIPVNAPGLYTYYVKDFNGCKAEGSLNLTTDLPTGLDKLPYGCYDVCGPVSFCAGTIPSGWKGQWTLNGSNYGPVIPTNGNIATTFNSPGTYVLNYIPVNPATHCSAVSKPITINFISLPAFTITSSGPAQLCIGAGGSVLLTVTPQSTEYNYEWFLNGVSVGFGYTYNATAPGSYTVEISKNECCVKTVGIDVIEINCCFENPGVEFTPITTPYTVNGKEFWFNKYYIDAPIFVPSGAILDLTNVDCVFGPNGEIIVQNRGFLRCNNSVLRPCEKDDIWKGVTFTGPEASGWINTTTIKNAIVAVNIRSNETGVRLTDNSFIKCQTSVRLEKSRRQQSISGNTFEIDESRLEYPSTPTEYWAIWMRDVEMQGLIAQNQFRHVQPRKTSNIYYGIYSAYSNFTASENQFNDMYRAVDITTNSNVIALEENVVKLNQMKETYDLYQIRITDCQNPVLVYQNQLYNGIGDRSTAGGIYCEKTTRTHIKDNSFDGFLIGVYGLYTRELHLNQNTLTNNTGIGLCVQSTERSIISCNDINSMATNSNQFGGGPLWGIADLDGNGSSSIYTNCIKNMNTAIYLRANENYNLPELVNNYMYNYKDNGIYNENYVGTIGNPGGPLAAGRNTFMSNNGNAGTTIDINSVTTFINEGGNFGILLTNNVGATTGPDEYYSTAACGQQIQQTYPRNQLDKYNICDIYYLEQWVFKDADGKYVLKQSAQEITQAVVNEHLKEGKQEILGMITAQMLTGDEPAKRASQAVLASNMDKNTMATVLVLNAVSNGNTQLATDLLASQQLSGIHADLRSVLTTYLELKGNPVLTASQRSLMKAIDDRENEYSPLARDIVQAYEGEHDYKFKKFPTPELKPATNVVQRAENNISVYPVPASQHVTLEYNVTDAKVQGVKIMSAIGAEVANFSYTLQAGTVDIDISTLAPGVYSVVLDTDNKQLPVMTGRFIKLQ